jgi:hypothetical protein
MEGSVLGEQYMDLKGQNALEYMQKLKKHCRQFNRDFTLLWHNSSFDTEEIYYMYENLVMV